MHVEEGHVNILVVEDDERTVSFLQQSLEEDGHTVDVALDGTTALTKGRQSPAHDLIVLDRDIFAIDPFDLHSTRVLATYLDGRELAASFKAK